jgi:L-alanine-DL-glutamate epimerase-like enolase superfamily enzyme
MKITRLRTEIVHLPIDPPILTAILGSIRSADCVLTFLDTDEGMTGEGLVLSINNRRLSVILDMVRQLEDLVVGLDPRMGGALNARAWKELNFLGYEGVSIVGLAAIDNALWDLRGKAAGLNVAHLIGACRSAVPTYASGGLWLGSSIDELQNEARSFVERGFRAMKTRVGPDRTGTHGRARGGGAGGCWAGCSVDGRCQSADERETGDPHWTDDGGSESDLVRGTGHLPRPRGRSGDQGRARYSYRFR